MKKVLSLLLFLGITFSFAVGSFAEVSYLSEKPSFTITCVGDSITEGLTTSGGVKGVNAFPYVLNTLLNQTGVADYNVINCGKSATTALLSGDRPYKETKEYRDSKTTNPDVVIICLGANDAKPANWNAEKYENDYYNLIVEYMSLPSQPEVYLFYTTYVADQSKTSIRGDVVQGQIIPIQHRIAENLGLKIIDLNSLTRQNSTKYNDGVHPNDALQAMMAEYIFNCLCSEQVIGLSKDLSGKKVTMIDPNAKADNPAVSGPTSSGTGNPDGSVDNGGANGTNGADGEAEGGFGWIVWVIVGAVVLIGAACLILKRKRN